MSPPSPQPHPLSLAREGYKILLEGTSCRGRTPYNRTIAEDEWAKLAEVYCSQTITNTDGCRKLLFNRCILEYREMDDQQNVVTWYDIHPVIEDIPQFRRALAEMP